MYMEVPVGMKEVFSSPDEADEMKRTHAINC